MGKNYYHALDGYALCFRDVIYAQPQPGDVHRSSLHFHLSFLKEEDGRV